MSIAERIVRSMNRLGLSQRLLADKSGCSEVVISRYTRGVRRPNAETLQKICPVLQVSSDYILGIDNSFDDFKMAEELIHVNADRWSADEKLELINILSKKGD